MELSGVIQPHYVDFSEVVDPVSLSSRLRSLTHNDRDVIQCSRFQSRLLGVMKLYDAIIGKVKWPELYAALMEENLTGLARKLEEEYFQQHPAARPIPQDENLNPEVQQFEQEPEGKEEEQFEQEPEGKEEEQFEQEPERKEEEQFEQEPERKEEEQFEQEPTESSTDSDVKDSARTNIIIFGQACYNVKDGVPVVIYAQTVNFQHGDNNCININSSVEQAGTTEETESANEYVVCVSSESLDRSESLENTVKNNSPITVLHNRCPAEPTTPQNISPQFSSSSSDSQDGSSPKVCFPDETAEHTSEKLVFQERNGGEMIYMAPSDNSSSSDNTNTESHGPNKIYDVKVCFEDLGIALRTVVKRCEDREKDEEETELKKLT